MIREAIEYVVGLGKREQVQVHGIEYSTDRLHVIEEPKPDALQVRTLSSIVDYLKSNFDKVGQVIINVDNHEKVSVYSSLSATANRNNYIVAKASVPRNHFDSFEDPERFVIWMQSGFEPNEDQGTLLKIVGNIQEENVKTVGDDGVTQQVTVRNGVSTTANAIIPNSVDLKPFRTFTEIEQPLTRFIFRMRKGPEAGLFEADGGAWKAEAMRRIKVYLEGHLSEEIEAGRVTILA